MRSAATAVDPLTIPWEKKAAAWDRSGMLFIPRAISACTRVTRFRGRKRLGDRIMRAELPRHVQEGRATNGATADIVMILPSG